MLDEIMCADSEVITALADGAKQPPPNENWCVGCHPNPETPEDGTVCCGCPPDEFSGPPSAHELADALREFLHALDDPRHITHIVDRGEGINVMDYRAKLDAVLARL